MESISAEKWRHREQWMEDRLKEHGWSETEIKRGRRYRKSGEYIRVGIIWSLLILPLPIGLSLIVYGYYLRFRYQDLGEEYMRVRTDMKREFNHQGGPDRPRIGPPELGDGRVSCRDFSRVAIPRQAGVSRFIETSAQATRGKFRGEIVT